MKRSPFKRKKPWIAKFKPKSRARRTKLRLKGVSTTSQLKEEIQAVLRSIVIVRDGGCILRKIRHCSRGVEDGVVYQADHLITRANNATYADSRLVVCVCRPCHFWKKYHEPQYNALVRSILSKERVDLWDRCLQDMWRPIKHGAYDWKLEIINLYRELANVSSK